MPLKKIFTLLLAALVALSISITSTHVFASNSKKLQYAKADLNKDGIKDVLKIKTTSGLSTLSINNHSISLNPNAYPYCNGYFRIIDIKTSDKYKEIQIDFEEDGGYSSTGFYYYDGKSIVNIGYTVGVYKSTDGKGTISIGKWCGFLEYIVNYKLDKNRKLQKIIRSTYPVNKKSSSLIAVALQKSPSNSKTAVNLKKGEKITIVGISFKKNNQGINEHWLLIKNTKGKTGWINVDKLMQQKHLSIDHIFEGLAHAG